MSATTTIPIRCGQCREPLQTPIVCTCCQTVYPIPEGVDYFTLLGLERRYDLDLTELAAAFRSITSSVHPDRFATRDERVQALATQLSAEVNRAYEVLRDPISRGDYLLELHGGPSAAEDRGVDPALLMEIMETRETLDAARVANDTSGMARLREHIGTSLDACLERIARWTGALVREKGGDDSDLRHRLRRELNAARYWSNLAAQAA